MVLATGEPLRGLDYVDRGRQRTAQECRRRREAVPGWAAGAHRPRDPKQCGTELLASLTDDTEYTVENGAVVGGAAGN